MKAALGAAIGLVALVVALGANAGSSALAGFAPQWLTAVSANELWLGGHGRVLHTADGGAPLQSSSCAAGKRGRPLRQQP